MMNFKNKKVMLNIQNLVEDLILELATRVGPPDLGKEDHVRELFSVMEDFGISQQVQIQIRKNLLNEADEKEFKLPILNKEIPYKDNDGNAKRNKVGNLITLPDEHPGRKAAERELDRLSPEEEQKAKDEIGGQGKSTADKQKEKQQTKTDTTDTEDAGPQTVTGRPVGADLSDPDGEFQRRETEQNDLIGSADKKKTPDDETDRLRELSKEELSKIDHEITDTQLNMTKAKAAEQSKLKEKKNVGAGTAESRAGEAMVHKGLRLLKEGKSFEEIEAEFKQLVSQKDHILNSKEGKRWVGSSIAAIKKINEVIGIDNIETVAWDTDAGRLSIGIDPDLDTSSDMFLRTKDGKNIGISLKKDGNIFLNNGGWETQSKLLLKSLKGTMSEDVHKRLSDAMSIDTYKKDLEERYIKTLETITPDVLKKSFERLKQNPKDQKDFSGSSRDRYFEILENPDLLIKKIRLKTANVDEKKSYAKLLQTYHKDEYKYLRESDNELTNRAFKVLNESEEAKVGMNKHIIRSMHITETLGLNERLKDGGVDGFITTYGIEPHGSVLNEETLITLLGSKFKQKLDESINEVRSGKTPYTELEDFIVNSIEIDYESGQILFKHESNKKYPLFVMRGRTRGIGTAPVMELKQTPFMAHALKMGTFNTDEWDDASLKKFETDILNPDEGD